MIKKEIYGQLNDGTKLYRTYSDIGNTVRQAQTGIIYDEAIDVETSAYTYEETGEISVESYEYIRTRLADADQILADLEATYDNG